MKSLYWYAFISSPLWSYLSKRHCTRWLVVCLNATLQSSRILFFFCNFPEPCRLVSAVNVFYLWRFFLVYNDWLQIVWKLARVASLRSLLMSFPLWHCNNTYLNNLQTAKTSSFVLTVFLVHWLAAPGCLPTFLIAFETVRVYFFTHCFCFFAT